MEKMMDLIERQDAIEAINGVFDRANLLNRYVSQYYVNAVDAVRHLPSVQPEIIRCKDCKFYTPMNRETKTGICSLTLHQNFGDNWFCAGAERRTDEQSD